MRAQSIEHKKLNIISQIANIDDNSIIDSILKFLKPTEKLVEAKNEEKNNVLENIQAGLLEVDLIKKGKLKTTSFKDFLNDL